jgi:hypothetical protein
MHFPVEDVVKNVRTFVGSVKRATGNKEEDQEDRKKDLSKPGVFCPTQTWLRDSNMNSLK